MSCGLTESMAPRGHGWTSPQEPRRGLSECGQLTHSSEPESGLVLREESNQGGAGLLLRTEVLRIFQFLPMQSTRRQPSRPNRKAMIEKEEKLGQWLLAAFTKSNFTRISINLEFHAINISSENTF